MLFVFLWRHGAPSKRGHGRIQKVHRVGYAGEGFDLSGFSDTRVDVSEKLDTLSRVVPTDLLLIARRSGTLMARLSTTCRESSYPVTSSLDPRRRSMAGRSSPPTCGGNGGFLGCRRKRWPSAPG